VGIKLSVSLFFCQPCFIDVGATLAGLLRCGKSCRLRWTNYLRPDLKRGAFSEAEEDQIIQLHVVRAQTITTTNQ